MVYVADIEIKFSLPRMVIPTVHLCPISDSRPDFVAAGPF
jgi:hypothetical protein